MQRPSHQTQGSGKKDIHFPSAEENTVKLLSEYPAKLSFMLQDEIKAFSMEGEWKKLSLANQSWKFWWREVTKDSEHCETRGKKKHRQNK